MDGARGYTGAIPPMMVVRQQIIEEYVERKTAQMSDEQCRSFVKHTMKDMLGSYTYPDDTLKAVVKNDFPDILEKHYID